jgi:hypothetical protein
VRRAALYGEWWWRQLDLDVEWRERDWKRRAIAGDWGAEAREAIGGRLGWRRRGTRRRGGGKASGGVEGGEARGEGDGDGGHAGIGFGQVTVLSHVSWCPPFLLSRANQIETRGPFPGGETSRAASLHATSGLSWMASPCPMGVQQLYL